MEQNHCCSRLRSNHIIIKWPITLFGILNVNRTENLFVSRNEILFSSSYSFFPHVFPGDFSKTSRFPLFLSEDVDSDSKFVH